MNDSAKHKRKVKILPVVETMSADLLTPLAVYLKLSKIGGSSFLLESVAGGESLARYSFIGVDPEFIVSGNDREIAITRDGNTRTDSIPMFQFMREHFVDNEVLAEHELPPFIGGAIGYFGFNCTGWFEPSLRKSPAGDDPDASFMFFRSVIALDHAKQVVKIISLVFPDEAGGRDISDQTRSATERNSAIRSTLENDPVELPPPASIASDTKVSSNWSKE